LRRAALDVDIAGLVPGTSLDRITATDGVLLAGTLNLMLRRVPPYARPTGANVVLIEFDGTSSGIFSTVNDRAIGVGWYLQEE